MDIPIEENDIPFLSAQQMIEVDRLMVEEYKIELIQMMENAGRNLAHLAKIRFMSNNPTGKQVAILAGTGGNGGGALVCARRLHNWGANVSVFMTRSENEFTKIPGKQLRILQQMNVKLSPANEIIKFRQPDLIIDGLIGYNLKGSTNGTVAELIRWSNSQNCPVLSLDIPSGVDATNGHICDPAIRATATMTLALPKAGLREPNAKVLVGELYLVDISVPPALYKKLNLDLNIGPLFSRNDILRLW